MKNTAFFLLPLLAAILALPACERDEPNPDDARRYMEQNPYGLDRDGRRPSAPAEIPALTISPTEVTAEAVGDVFVFCASGGQPPYTWNVANPASGTIAHDNGNPCSYTVAQLKKNSVWVKDSRGRVATATIGYEAP